MTSSEYAHTKPSINIVNTNYSKYGTSVYQQLYHSKYHDARRNNSRLAAASSNNTVPSSQLFATESLDSELMMDDDSTTSRFRKKYRSLLQNYNGSSSKAKRLINKLHDYGSSDSFSIFSLRSNYSNRNNNSLHSKNHATAGTQEVIFEDQRPYLDINSLPVEVLAIVFENLSLGGYLHDKKSLLRCLYVSRKFYQAGKIVLYKSVHFTSTYRVAQFVTCLRLHPQNGLHVKSLDLSNLKNGLLEDNDKSKYDSSIDEEEEEEEEREGEEGEEEEEREERRHERNVPQEEREQEEENVDEDIDRQVGNNNEGFDEQRDTDQESTAQYNPTDGESNEDGLPLIALAGWRDWRYRFDPLYSSPILNSYRLKKITSRSSSISSSSSSSSKNTNKRYRSSSVTSFTSSLMSSLYSSSLTRSATTLSSISLSSSSAQETSTHKRSGKWFKSIFSSSNHEKRKSKAHLSSGLKTPNRESVATQAENSRTTSVKFDIQTNSRHQPFHEKHPYTNKFLLKYALYKDLPLGYILHLVSHCPNLENLNLSHLIISSDFQVTLRNIRSKNISSLLPTVEEKKASETIFGGFETEPVGRSLDVVYLTDSNKSYQYYEESCNRDHQTVSMPHPSYSALYAGSWIYSNYPPPINQSTKFREERKRNSGSCKEYTLTKLEPHHFFEKVSDKSSRLKSLQLDGVVWCNQQDVKSFVLSRFQEFSSKEPTPTYGTSCEDITDLQLSFQHSGMGRNLSWASTGNVVQFVTLIILGELLEKDELSLEDLFNVRMERYGRYAVSGDLDDLEMSNTFTVKFYEGEMCFRLRIRSGNLLGLKVYKESDVTEVVCTVNRFTEDQSDDIDEGMKRISELSRQVLGRIQRLKTAQLRRHVGENNYFMAIM